MNGDSTVIATTLCTVSIARAKITDYLLDPDHIDGSSKARFFLSFGFAGDEPEIMQRALLEHLLFTSVHSLSVRPGGHGSILTAVGLIGSPDGRNPIIRSVWMWRDARVSAPHETLGDNQPDHGAARLVTAYPYRA